jgi:hypothetical protein
VTERAASARSCSAAPGRPPRSTTYLNGRRGALFELKGRRVNRQVNYLLGKLRE